MTAFSFDLVTPERVLWSGQAEAVSMRTDSGEITFLAHHSPFIGALDITVLRIHPGDGASDDGSAGGSSAASSEAGEAEEVRAAVHGGFVHVDENKVVVAAPVAEMASEIDTARARQALESATERVAEEAAEGPAAPEKTPDAGDDTPEAPAARGGGAFFDPTSADAALRRAHARLEAAGEPAE